MFPAQLMKLEALSWIVLLLPLLAAVGITLFALRDPKLSAKLSIAAVVGSFVVSLALFFLMQQPLQAAKMIGPAPFDWLDVGDLKIEL
ncbi:MAG: hypothetical protein DME26_02635, partial [Verrucomicrobia bacterium]